MPSLHLGCGSVHIQGLIHIDLAPFPHVDIVHRCDKLPMYDDSSIDFIYASHVLEHFGRNDVTYVLSEWYRILKKDTGLLRLAVPDFTAVLENYLPGHPSRGIQSVLGLVCGGQKDIYDYHKMIFDRYLLTDLLHQAGFEKVEEWDWRQTSHASVDDYSQAYLPHMDKRNGRLMSLNLQAYK